MKRKSMYRVALTIWLVSAIIGAVAVKQGIMASGGDGVQWILYVAFGVQVVACLVLLGRAARAV